MTYELAFDRRALKEWQKLGHTIREQFKKKLAERLENPRVPAAKLHGHADRYKIKLRASGYRLVYQVIDEKSRFTRYCCWKKGKQRSLSDRRFALRLIIK